MLIRATLNTLERLQLWIPAPGGHYVVCERFENHNNLTRGIGGICTWPADVPRVGWDLEQES